MSRCAARTKDLERCRNDAERGSIFCRRHRWWWVITLFGGIVAVTTVGANVSQMFGFTFPGPLGITITPTLSDTPTTLPSTLTATATFATETSTPTNTSTYTPIPSDTPTLISPSPTEIPLLSKDCFSIEKWTPYEKDLLISKDNGCWNLYKWGFTAKENEIIVVAPNSSKGIFHGIYTPVKENVEINFKIRVDKFDVDPGVTANIGIGIINLDPPGPATSRLVFYHYIPQESEFYIPMKTGVDAKYKDLISTTLKFSTPQMITIKMDGPFLTIIFDDDTEVNLTVPFEKRAFWVSYVVPPSSELIMSIYDLEIK